jgi:hypothetical protein
VVLALVVLTAFLPQPSGAYHEYYTGGYTAVDSTQPQGPAYEFIDISETGTALALTDDGAEQVALPFGFEFFGVEYSEVFISSNGLLSFTGDLPTNGGGQQYFPDPSPPNGLIAGYWSDLDPSMGGVVAYETFGDAPNRTFLVMYKDVPQWRPQPVSLIETEHASFEIVLHEGTTRAVVHFKHVAPQEEDVTVFTREYVSGIEDEYGYLGLVYEAGEFVREEVAVAFEQTETPPPPPPPPPPPFTTTYTGPFAAAGADHTASTGNLPGRHATSSSTSESGGRITVKGAADSLTPTAGAFPARGDSTGWIRLAHEFAETTRNAIVNVRLRVESLAMRASAVADPEDRGLRGPSAYAEVGAALHDDHGYCAYPQYYGYPYPTPSYPLFGGGCEASIGSVTPAFPLGERSTLLAAPKEIVLTYDLYVEEETKALFFNLSGLAYADAVEGVALLRATASVLEVSITEYGGSCPYPDCTIVVIGTEPL